MLLLPWLSRKMGHHLNRGKFPGNKNLPCPVQVYKAVSGLKDHTPNMEYC